MKSLFFISAVLLAMSSPAVAEMTYAGYEGKNAVREGEGGTKITKNGIDYWTTGAPPRKFQVLGILTDKRKNRRLDGKVLGSPNIAKRTIAAGGDAVIFLDSSTRLAATVGIMNGTSTSYTGLFQNIERTTTNMLVVKYLP